jgi:hypothetical protein
MRSGRPRRRFHNFATNPMLYQLLYVLHYSDPVTAPWPVAGLMLGAAGWLGLRLIKLIA